MQKPFTYLFLSISLFILTISILTPLSVSDQPPIDKTTLYVGNPGWGPKRADPVRIYDTYSQALVFNVYDTLISSNYDVYWNFVPKLATNIPTRADITKTTDSVDVNLANPTDSHWNDGSTCVGWIDNNATGNLDTSDILYFSESDGSYRTWRVQTLQTGNPVTATFWRGSYTFTIRTSPIINFYNETGDIVDAFNVSDAEYSFERGLVQDQAGSPMWMLYKPLFGTLNSDPFNSNTTEPTATTLAHLIDNAVEVNGNDLVINIGMTFPDNAFKQTLCQTWSSIVSREFSISIGCWNADLYSDSDGDGYPNWWNSTVARRISRSPYDTTGNLRYCGTGPFRVTTFDATNYKVILTRNTGYWGGWPAPNCGNVFSTGYVDTVQINYIADWNTRKTEFLSGTLDTCAVPAANMSELLNPTTKEPIQSDIKNIKNLVSLSLNSAFFTFTIAQTSAYIWSGNFPDGIPTNFFNNTHVRKAFAYAFNRTELVKQPQYAESICRETPLIQGLSPDYHTPQTAYAASYSAAETQLKQADFNGTNVWNAGFKMTLAYITGNDATKIAFEQLRDFFANLSTYDGRTGPPFQILVGEYSTCYLCPVEITELPIWSIGWLADYADADNFIRPYMHSLGDFANLQNYRADNGWGKLKDELIDAAVNTPDGPQRAAIYNQLENMYIEDCPSIPLIQPLSRMWMKYWVKGWYYNALAPSSDYYRMWKYDNCWFNNSGTTQGISDGVCGMRDISRLIGHYNAKAPDPSRSLDPKWTPVYGANGCVDPYGDRVCNMRDIANAIVHFNHKNNTLTP